MTDTHAHGLAAAGRRADSAGTAAVPAIELTGVSKEFRTGGDVVAAVRAMDLRIVEGEFFSLLGPSGCGKTTTMRMVAGFEDPTAGTVRLHGRHVTGVPPNKRDVNMVFQSYALFPHMNVFENVAFGLRRRNVPKYQIARQANDMLEMVNHPRALLLDGPLGARDLKLRQAMQVELKRIQREVGITFVYVTHDQNEALTMSDRIAVMNDGLIEQLASPREIYEHPATRFVAGFIGTSNLLTGTASEITGKQAVMAVSQDERIVVPVRDLRVSEGDQLELTVRPEKIEISTARPADRSCTL